MVSDSEQLRLGCLCNLNPFPAGTMLSAFTARPIIELKQRDKSKIETILAYGMYTFTLVWLSFYLFTWVSTWKGRCIDLYNIGKDLADV